MRYAAKLLVHLFLLLFLLLFIRVAVDDVHLGFFLFIHNTPSALAAALAIYRWAPDP